MDTNCSFACSIACHWGNGFFSLGDDLLLPQFFEAPHICKTPCRSFKSQIGVYWIFMMRMQKMKTYKTKKTMRPRKLPGIIRWEINSHVRLGGGKRQGFLLTSGGLDLRKQHTSGWCRVSLPSNPPDGRQPLSAKNKTPLHESPE